MKVILILAAALAACVVLSGCSTHRRDLEANAPPQGLAREDQGEIAEAAMALLNDEARHADLLSSDALAPLTAAAAVLFERTGSTQAFALTRRYADLLLMGRVVHDGVSGFLGGAGGFAPQARATALSGLALANAYAATRDPRYRSAVVEAAVDVTKPALGWVSTSNGTGVRDRSDGPRPNVAMTANAALLLRRAGELGRRDLLVKAHSALSTIYSSQVAVGRWYADVGGHIPMSLGEWATTLFDLLANGSKASLGIVGGSVPALYRDVFQTNGHVLKERQPVEPTTVALSLRALAAFPATSFANRVSGYLIHERRRDGTVAIANSDDTVSQADFALALAQMVSRSARRP